MKLLSKALVFATCFSVATSVALAQYKVHAMSGTVTAIHPKIQMTTLAPDDGTSGSFEWLSKTGGTVDFEKSISSKATPVEKFTTKDAHVIAYYFGSGNVRTLVALQDLGPAPVDSALGIVLRFNRKGHQLTIMNMSGAEETFQLDAKTVGDTDTGVMTNFKYDYTKNEQIRVLSTKSGTVETALLIVPAY